MQHPAKYNFPVAILRLLKINPTSLKKYSGGFLKIFLGAISYQAVLLLESFVFGPNSCPI